MLVCPFASALEVSHSRVRSSASFRVGASEATCWSASDNEYYVYLY